jgi:hypothetical protein
MQKPSQKHKTLTSEGRRFRSSFFLRLKQIQKAALMMGVVSSIDFFWSNAANPAMPGATQVAPPPQGPAASKNY